jgi:N-acetylmuramate 1-kinase
LTTNDLPHDARDFVTGWLGDGWRAVALAGDASVRAYYRLEAGGRNYILAYYPDSLRGDLDRFVRAFEAIAPHAPVPPLLARCEVAIGQEDVGDRTLYDLLRSDREAALPAYGRAVELLVGFQRAAPAAAAINPPFDRAKFFDELEMTRKYWVARNRGIDREAVHERLRGAFDRLATLLTTHPYVLCHRDYHGQNIHLRNGDMYVIDYQDMKMGPDTYDLASLLRDRGAGDMIGRQAEEALVDHYAALMGAEGAALRRRYYENLLQRSIKIIGTFARQAIVRNRTHYLDFIPSALTATTDALDHLGGWDELREIFTAGD